MNSDEIIDFMHYIYLESESLDIRDMSRQTTLNLGDADDVVTLSVTKTRITVGKIHYFVTLSFDKEE